MQMPGSDGQGKSLIQLDLFASIRENRKGANRILPVTGWLKARFEHEDDKLNSTTWQRCTQAMVQGHNRRKYTTREANEISLRRLECHIVALWLVESKVLTVQALCTSKTVRVIAYGHVITTQSLVCEVGEPPANKGNKSYQLAVKHDGKMIISSIPCTITVSSALSSE